VPPPCSAIFFELPTAGSHFDRVAAAPTPNVLIQPNAGR